MAIGLPIRLHSGWFGKLADSISHHRLKTVLVLAASGTLAGSLGLIIFSALIQSGSPRLLIMLLPHAFASVLACMLFFAALFSLEHRDP